MRTALHVRRRSRLIQYDVDGATLPFGDGSLSTKAPARLQVVSAGLAGRFAPATHCLYEWTSYWLDYPGADVLRIGDDFLRPVKGSLFEVRFENQLGLSRIQPLAGSTPLCPPLIVEVLSPKFPSPLAHLEFYSTLLDDLYLRASRLPFTFAAPTTRTARESLRPPTPLFTLHYLCAHASEINAAIATVLARPHRQLRDHPRFVPLHEASEADADVLIGILQSPEEWVPNRTLQLAHKLGGYAPRRVWQRQPEETFDTPENRFVLSFLGALLAAAEALPNAPWWHSVPQARQRTVRELTSALRQTRLHAMFAEVGQMQRLPASSQVLLRREGYRQMLELWQRFHRSRRPVFEPLQHAMEVRDVATLYEMWVFFALTEQIGDLLGIEPVVNVDVSDVTGLERNTVARFGKEDRLVYNRTFSPPRQSYSVPLRPDFTWIRDGVVDVVLDAKFRMDQYGIQDESDDTPQATAKRADLYKMHTYRDALRVRAAVSIYPGDVSLFYECPVRTREAFDLQTLVLGDRLGVGAMPLQPGE